MNSFTIILYRWFKRVCFFFGKISSFVLPSSCLEIIYLFANVFYSGRISKNLKSCGRNLYVKRKIFLFNPNCIQIGDDVRIHKNAILAAHAKNAELIIGNGVIIGELCHITCLSRVIIQDGVLLGKKCIITDNSHGEVNKESLESIPPNKRPLVSPGDVMIEKNVWLGDNVVVLPGVTIGEGCVVGASAVVTKSLPPYSVSVGNPAKVIKVIR